MTEQLATRRQLFIIGMLIAIVASGCDNAVATPPLTPSPRAIATLIPEPSPTPAVPLAFEISGMNYYEDPVGSLRFLLEVRNLNDFEVEGVRAAVFLKDADGQIVDSQYGYAKLDILRRGGTAPIMVVFFPEAPEFSAYDIEIEGQKADYMAQLLHPGLRIADDFGRVGQWVPYEVLGEIQNVGDWDAESITLLVTCYDVDRKVVAVSTGRPAERAVPAGSSSDFLVSMGAVAGEIASCKVQVEGLIANYD